MVTVRKIKIAMLVLILVGTLLLVGCIQENMAIKWNNKGFALASQGKYSEAIECFDKAIAIAPNYATAWNNKGYMFYLQGKYSEAIECYDKALELDSNYALAWINKGNALTSQ